MAVIVNRYIVVMFAVIVDLSGSVYLYFPERTRQSDAAAKCGQYGMTLLEIYNQDQLDTWNSVKATLFSLQKEDWKKEPWLGLMHDGSPTADLANYRWLEAGTVAFLTWAAGEPDYIPQDACVRIRENKFGTRSCTYFGYSTVCQPSGQSNATMTQEVFQSTDQTTADHRTTTRYRKSSEIQQQPGVNWLVATPMSDVHDVSTCVLTCHFLTDCSFVTFDPISGCVIFRHPDVILPSIH